VLVEYIRNKCIYPRYDFKTLAQHQIARISMVKYFVIEASDLAFHEPLVESFEIRKPNRRSNEPTTETPISAGIKR